MFRTKSLSDELFLHFFFESSESDVFSFIYMIRIRFFGPRELNQKRFRRARYSSPGQWIRFFNGNEATGPQVSLARSTESRFHDSSSPRPTCSRPYPPWRMLRGARLRISFKHSLLYKGTFRPRPRFPSGSIPSALQCVRHPHSSGTVDRLAVGTACNMSQSSCNTGRLLAVMAGVMVVRKAADHEQRSLLRSQHIWVGTSPSIEHFCRSEHRPHEDD